MELEEENGKGYGPWMKASTVRRSSSTINGCEHGNGKCWRKESHGNYKKEECGEKKQGDIHKCRIEDYVKQNVEDPII